MWKPGPKTTLDAMSLLNALTMEVLYFGQEQLEMK